MIETLRQATVFVDVIDQNTRFLVTILWPTLTLMFPVRV